MVFTLQQWLQVLRATLSGGRGSPILSASPPPMLVQVSSQSVCTHCWVCKGGWSYTLTANGLLHHVTHWANHQPWDCGQWLVKLDLKLLQDLSLEAVTTVCRIVSTYTIFPLFSVCQARCLCWNTPSYQSTAPFIMAVLCVLPVTGNRIITVWLTQQAKRPAIYHCISVCFYVGAWYVA